jgi:hypothetical protein
VNWLAWLGLGIAIGGALGVALMACLVMSRDADDRPGNAPQGAREQEP